MHYIEVNEASANAGALLFLVYTKIPCIELTWLALEINDETDYSHQDTALGANIGVRHGFTNRFEGGILLRRI